MGRQIRYGMVGGSMTAFIGEVHRKAIAFDPRVELSAGCFSSDEGRNREVGAVYDIDGGRIYADYREMAEVEAARADGIDFVVICTPNCLHYEAARCFLEHGINVVCEKPLCFEVKEAQELARITREKGLIFAVTHTYTGYTMTKVMREMIAEGKIGKIVSVNAEYIQDFQIAQLEDGAPERKNSAWRLDPQKSGIVNTVGDIGTHIENYVHYVTGMNIKRLCATTNKFGHELELNANMLVEYENGVNGAYWCSQVAAGKQNGLCVRIYGDEGSLEWEQQYPDYLKYTPKGQPTQILSRGCAYITQQGGAYSRIPAGHPEGYYVAFANIYKNVATTLIKIKNGEKPTESDLDFPTAEDGLAGVKFIHAVVESAENGSKWVEL